VEAWPLGGNGQFAARPGWRSHHQTHDAFAVHLFAVLFHEHVALNRWRFDEERGGPGVNAELVRDVKARSSLESRLQFLALIWLGDN